MNRYNTKQLALRRMPQCLAVLAISATTTVALAQSVSRCYHRATLTPNQTSPNNSCATYTVCPAGHLCAPGGWKLTPEPITTITVNCTTYLGGSGTFPNCTGGSLVLGTTATAVVPNQQCTGLCLFDADPE